MHLWAILRAFSSRLFEMRIEIRVVSTSLAMVMRSLDSITGVIVDVVICQK